MKIFNWVHRRFLHNVHNSAISLPEGRNVKKAEPFMNDAETKALLKNVGPVDAMDGWRDGILTIGTFGFDAYKEEYEEEDEDEEEEEEDGEEEYSFTSADNEEEDAKDQEGELNPLVFAGYKKGVTGEVKGEDVIVTVDGMLVGGAPELAMGLEYSGIVASDEGKKKGERTTLADLFLADSEMMIKRKGGSKEAAVVDSGKKPAPLRPKNGLSFAKKLIPRVKEDSRPIRKLHRLMRKMLKRKIHPELQGKVCDSDSEIKPTSNILGLLSSDEMGANDRVSLLPTLDAIV
ncbi:protein TILLER ANGLE CONTROL 1 [Malania oleifera]|uniref:protein TILLER ANGLE CONTROL 1 n=1 Tax=Malania oleifera TaxID=397392 RepID=UPI0025AE9FFE|nr:protein TILLER ANGLE CONTROL 1 [Malania oleifera]